jgi:hypothetical protein
MAVADPDPAEPSPVPSGMGMLAIDEPHSQQAPHSIRRKRGGNAFLRGGQFVSPCHDPGPRRVTGVRGPGVALRATET